MANDELGGCLAGWVILGLPMGVMYLAGTYIEATGHDGSPDIVMAVLSGVLAVVHLTPGVVLLVWLVVAAIERAGGLARSVPGLVARSVARARRLDLVEAADEAVATGGGAEGAVETLALGEARLWDRTVGEQGPAPARWIAAGITPEEAVSMIERGDRPDEPTLAAMATLTRPTIHPPTDGRPDRRSHGTRPTGPPPTASARRRGP